VVGLTVLSVMIVMATVGLIFALATQSSRRANDAGIVSKARRTLFPSRRVEVVESSPEPSVLAPAQLAALGYLPPDRGVLVGVHVEDLLSGAIGKELLAQPLRVGERDFQLSNILSWTSLRLEEIDHAVVALKPDAPLSTLLVVRTRQDYDPKKVRSALKAERTGGGMKTLYQIEVPGLSIRPLLWCADNRTLVLALSPSELQAAPNSPVEGLGHLPAAIRTVLQERMGTGGPLWAVGHADNWSETAAGLLLQRANPEDVKRLEQVRTFGVWLQQPSGGNQPILTLQATLACANANAARELEEKSLRPHLTAEARLVRSDNWLTLQTKLDLAGLRKALEK